MENSRQKKSPADAQHAIGFGERQLNTRHIADAKGDGDGIITAVAKRQHLAVALNESDTCTGRSARVRRPTSIIRH